MAFLGKIAGKFGKFSKQNRGMLGRKLRARAKGMKKLGPGAPAPGRKILPSVEKVTQPSAPPMSQETILEHVKSRRARMFGGK